MFQNIPYGLTYQVFPDNVTFGQVLLLSSPGRVAQQEPKSRSGMCVSGRPAFLSSGLPRSPPPAAPPAPAPCKPRGAEPSLHSDLLKRSCKQQPQPGSPAVPIPTPTLCSFTAPVSADQRCFRSGAPPSPPPGRAPPMALAPSFSPNPSLCC